MSNDTPQDDAPIFADEPDPRMEELIEFAKTTYVSARVRRECEDELAEGKKNGWKWRKFQK